jgi:hypothetical protein
MELDYSNIGEKEKKVIMSPALQYQAISRKA